MRNANVQIYRCHLRTFALMLDNVGDDRLNLPVAGKQLRVVPGTSAIVLVLILPTLSTYIDQSSMPHPDQCKWLKLSTAKYFEQILTMMATMNTIIPIFDKQM